MFTGIIQGTAEVVEIDKKENFQTHTIKMPEALCGNLQPGASVAHNGCCLTVTQINGQLVSFDLMQETLNVTNLGLLTIGQYVNIERAAKFGDEIGGHQMSGHIMTMATITEINRSENNYQIGFKIDSQYQAYIFSKGYIGIDGISLTICDVKTADDLTARVKNCRFSVNLIPETLTRTNIANRSIGDSVNIEIDPQTQAIVDTVNRVLQQRHLS